MTTDPVQEARRALLDQIESLHDYMVELDAYAAAIRREEAARLLPVLRNIEWGGEIDFCPGCSAVQWKDQHESWCLLAAEINHLEALRGVGDA
jgi:hypothetical protein